jgi:hypothetical protein
MNLKKTALVFWSGDFVFCGWKFIFCNGTIGILLMVHLFIFSPALILWWLSPTSWYFLLFCYNE